MDVIIEPSRLSGSVEAVASKSVAHRLLILAALADTTVDLDCNASSEDIQATCRCLEGLGARIARTRKGFRVNPIPRTCPPSAGESPVAETADPKDVALLDCGESGSTLRFLLPVVCALGRPARLTGQGRLADRPLSPLYEELVAHGCALSQQGTFPLEVSGRLDPGTFVLPGDVSSQYVTGLLLAATLMEDQSTILVAEPIQSEPYITLTISALAAFGHEVAQDRVSRDGKSYRSFVVFPSAQKAPTSLAVEGDWSNAAFWLAAGAMGASPLEVKGVNLTSVQGDRSILAALALFGARCVRRGDAAAVGPDRLTATRIDVSAFPDLVPPLAAIAACAEGTTRLTGAARLRLKESDRLETVSAALRAFGVEAQAQEDELVITGSPTLAEGTVDAAGDHRIAMMAAICAAVAQGPTTILGAQAVAKSYPTFFEDFASLGGIWHVRKEA